MLQDQAQNHHSDDEEIDYGKMARMELMRLHRQYRLMEGDKHEHDIDDGSIIVMSKQLRILTMLKEEKDDLEIDLGNAECQQIKMKDKRSLKFISELVHKYEKYRSEIGHCLDEIMEIEKQVDNITQRVIAQNLKIMSLFGQSLTPPMAEKRLRTLENRLYQKTTKYDTLVSENNKLRLDINNILAERGAYHKRGIFVRRCTAKIKSRLNEIVDATTAIYDTRDEYANKIKVIREKDEKETRFHVHELAEIQRMKHDSKKFHAYMNTKCQSRGQLEGEKERQVRHLMTKEKELDATLSKYKRTFKAILALGFTNDIETLGVHYFEEEQSNFSKFQYLNDVHNETEVLKESVMLAKEQIEKDMALQKEEAQERSETLEKKQAVLTEHEYKIEDVNEQLIKRDTEMNICIRQFEATFEEMGCEETYKQFLGNRSGISPNNISFNFKLLEKKVEDLLLMKESLLLRKSVELEGCSLIMKSVVLNQTKNVPPSGGPFKTKVIIAGRIDATDEEGEDDKWLSNRPLSRSEIKYIILERLAATEAELSNSKLSNGSFGESESQDSIYRRSSIMPHPIKKLDISKIETKADSSAAPLNDKARSKGRSKSRSLEPDAYQPKVDENKESASTQPRTSITPDTNTDMPEKLPEPQPPSNQ